MHRFTASKCPFYDATCHLDTRRHFQGVTYVPGGHVSSHCSGPHPPPTPPTPPTVVLIGARPPTVRYRTVVVCDNYPWVPFEGYSTTRGSHFPQIPLFLHALNLKNPRPQHYLQCRGWRRTRTIKHVLFLFVYGESQPVPFD